MSSYKETSAVFIENQCVFGAFPTQNQVAELEEWGVDLFVDLTHHNERKITPYTTTKEIINFPIEDRNIPDNMTEFCALIVKLCDEIAAGKKLYIHCKAGHGRSGIVVASILCYKYNLTPEESFKKTKQYHSTRPVHARRPRMNEYWKSKGAPQTEHQKQFVRFIFQKHIVSTTPRSALNSEQWARRAPTGKTLWAEDDATPPGPFVRAPAEAEPLQGEPLQGEMLPLVRLRRLEDVKQKILTTYLGPIKGESSEIVYEYRQSLYRLLWAGRKKTMALSPSSLMWRFEEAPPCFIERPIHSCETIDEYLTGEPASS